MYIKPNGEAASHEQKLFGIFERTIGTVKRIEMRVAVTGSDVIDHVKGVVSNTIYYAHIYMN